MSIWTDMIRWNIKNKKLLADGATTSVSIPINLNTYSTEFIKIATFIPKLNGSIRFSVDQKFISSGANVNDTLIEIRDSEGNVISSKISGPGNFHIDTFQIKAFERYEIYYKSIIQDPNDWVEIPETLKCIHTVIDTTDYFIFKANV